jgi:phospholipase C
MSENKLDKIEHIIVMMFENRSFDHMLGFLYSSENNQSPLGHPFEGLTGDESNPDQDGKPVPVFQIGDDSKYSYYMPKADPGEGFYNTNVQLFGDGEASSPAGPANQGFVKDWISTIQYDGTRNATQDPAPTGQLKNIPVFPDTRAGDIMGIFPPQMLPVLSGLAKGYAVCDHWYSSVPTETLPNRAFLHMATSGGQLADGQKTYNFKSIFKQLEDHDLHWGIYGNNGYPYTRSFCQDISSKITPAHGAFGSFDDFKEVLNGNGKLPRYSFLEPVWECYGNSQHPNYDVALGEQYMLEIYEAVRNSPYWEKTLLIITYDEHGGCYDHVTPPTNATPPDKDKQPGQDFGFDRFGVRVPTVLISPWIEAGTVHRVAKGTTPFDHTSILATLEQRFHLPPLSDRDKHAPDVGSVLTLDTPRKDDPMKGVTAPVSSSEVHIENHASEIQQKHAAALAELVTQETGKATTLPEFKTAEDAQAYIRKHSDERWR